MGRNLSTSSNHREVSHAQGHAGSNQKSMAVEFCDPRGEVVISIWDLYGEALGELLDSGFFAGYLDSGSPGATGQK